MITEKNVLDLVKYYDEEDFFKAFDYALKSIRCTFNRMGVPADKIYRRVQNIVKGITAERVFEKFLKDKNIPFNLKGRTLWHKVDQNDFIINEHTCDVKSLFIDINQNFYERNFKTLDNHEKLERFVDVCDFLIPQDQFTSKTQKKKYS